MFVTMAPRKHVTLTCDQKVEIIKLIEVSQICQKDF